MRITGGEHCGRRIHAPVSVKLRPALDQVRESLFNILARRVPDARVLDAFGGAGLLGLECLSRYAAETIFVEKHRPTAERLRALLREWRIDDRGRVIVGDFLKVAPTLAGRPFDLIFIDPPYHAGLITPSVLVVQKHHLLANDGLMIIKHIKTEPPEIPVGLRVVDERKYRDARVEFVALDNGDNE
ncbi:MAG TPA: 16S rRNA (guanine(966)-N(2))-methyltransferase RsmD [bacterium]|nr:16S rRNA (guanine(966)-N(2))-methyltransferase RsmD [bacterium]